MRYIVYSVKIINKIQDTLHCIKKMCKSQNLKSLIKTFSSLWQVRVFKSCRKTMKYGFQGISGW